VVAVTIEFSGILTAFEAGWNRTFFRGGIRRSLAAGLMIVAVGFGAAVAGDEAGVLVDAVPGLALARNIPTTFTDVVTCGLQTAFVARYVLDLRARRGPDWA
jgi:hypothetical protein